LVETQKFPILSGMTPTSGIRAGGANLTISGSDMDLFAPLGAFFENNTVATLYGFVIPEMT